MASQTLRSFVTAALLCAACAPALLCAQAPPAAEAQARFDALVASASQKYQSDDYAGAIEDFKAAYAIKAEPNILYNIGRISERMGAFEQAVSYYEQFVQQPDIELPNRQDALARSKALREVLALRAKPEPEPEPEPEPVIAAPPPPELSSPTLAYVLLGTSLATLAGAGVFTYMTDRAHNDFQEATSLSSRRAAASSGEGYALTADILWSATGALALSGVVVWALHEGDAQKPTATLRISPKVSLTQAGARLIWSY